MTSNGDAFGSLAALFTSGGGAPAAPAAPAALDAVTVLLAGNLPVMAGLWTTQYADEVARTSGPTALVRFERGEVTVELLRADGRQVPPAGPGAVARWLPRASTQVRRWIVCMPAETDPDTVLAAGVPVTVITGADEAAVTGAYLRLKHLADAGINAGMPLERVGLAVVGAPAEQATAAANRLAEAARNFLGIEVDLVSTLQRVERVESSARATYPAAGVPVRSPSSSRNSPVRARRERPASTPPARPRRSRCPCRPRCRRRSSRSRPSRARQPHLPPDPPCQQPHQPREFPPPAPRPRSPRFRSRNFRRGSSRCSGG